MALPPTQIYRYIRSSPEATKIALKKAGLLLQSACKNDQMERELRHAIDLYRNKPDDGMTGPNEQDTIAEILPRFLNPVGHWIASTPNYYPSSIFKIISPVVQVICRIRGWFY